jgi:hypothetical protein
LLFKQSEVNSLSQQAGRDLHKRCHYACQNHKKLLERRVNTLEAKFRFTADCVYDVLATGGFPAEDSTRLDFIDLGKKNFSWL